MKHTGSLPGLLSLLIVAGLAVLVLAVTGLPLKSGPRAQVIDHTAHWTLQPFSRTRLPQVDNLAIHRDGTLYATLELRYIGRVMRIDPQGSGRPVLKYLQRPDGLLLIEDTLYIAEEVERGRIIQYDLKTGRRRTLFRTHNPEGLARFGDRHLLLTEDIPGGRLLKLNRADGSIEILLHGLQRPEGLCVATDGSVYIAETLTGRILKYRVDTGSLTVLITGLTEPDQVKCHADGSLWITEDQDPNGRLLRYHENRLYLIARGLRSPQGITFDRQGNVYVAEQENARILKLTPNPGRIRDTHQSNPVQFDPGHPPIGFCRIRDIHQSGSARLQRGYFRADAVHTTDRHFLGVPL